MLTSLIEQATKLIGSAYLVSSLTPWVLFWLANATTFLVIVGPEAALRLWTARVAPSTFAVSLITLAVMLFLVFGALLVASFTTLFAKMLELTSLPVPVDLRQRRVAAARAEVEALAQQWGEAETLAAAVASQLHAATVVEGAPRPTAPAADRAAVAEQVDVILAGAVTAPEIERAAGVLTTAYGRFASAGFKEVHDRIAGAANDFAAELRARTSRAMLARVESYADVGQVARTDYGKALASADSYVSRVYNIESAVFWTRLQKVIPKEFMEVVRDAKVRLDFFTAVTLFAALYTIVWFVAMPHLLPAWRPVLLTTGVAAAVTWVAYRAAVESAFGFGQLFRSCFDLFRRDLLTALAITPPGTLAAEREIWQRLSRLIVLGQYPEPDIALKSAPPVANPKAVPE